MNNSERYVFAVYEIALEVRETLTYFITAPGQNHDYEKYVIRGNIIRSMTQPKTPFDLWCEQNGDIGKQVREKVTNFYNDVYGDDSRIIKTREENGKKFVYVEDALYMDLIDYIIGIRETFNDILNGFLRQLGNDKTLEPDFEKMIKMDERYFRAFAFRTLAVLTNTKFMEFNKAIREYLQANPQMKIEDAMKDPSVSFISNEMSKLFNLAHFLVQHSKETDEEFVNAQNKYIESLKIFTGENKVEDINKAFQEFANIFNEILSKSQEEFLKVFSQVFEEVRKFEENLKKSTETK